MSPEGHSNLQDELNFNGHIKCSARPGEQQKIPKIQRVGVWQDLQGACVTDGRWEGESVGQGHSVWEENLPAPLSSCQDHLNGPNLSALSLVSIQPHLQHQRASFTPLPTRASVLICDLSSELGNTGEKLMTFRGSSGQWGYLVASPKP